MKISETKLNESHIGSWVAYVNNGSTQFGRITSWNDRFVFVCFDDTGRGQAVDPDYLLWK